MSSSPVAGQLSVAVRAVRIALLMHVIVGPQLEPRQLWLDTETVA
jgi:hypothetical protein